jgi:alpha-tubulin suppressor-like RCC1 family protein
VLDKTSTVACWGAGSRGQLGNGMPPADASAPTPTPVPVSGVLNAVAVGTGGDHSCAPTTVGTIFCWGANERGQLGDGTTTEQATPIAVKGYP